MEDYTGVGYLEIVDFDEDGKLLVNTEGRPAVVKVFSSQCGHCVAFHPEFQKFASNTQSSVATYVVQVDGVKESERAIGQHLNEFFPDFRGFPSVYLYINGRVVSEFNENRTARALGEWINQTMGRDQVDLGVLQ